MAASIQTHGILQPIIVAPEGDGYQVVAGNRRLKAAVRAGLDGIPASVKPHLDEDTKYLINLVENIQRVDLSAKERVDAIRQLASSGQGVREISRGTGLAPSTISRWIRIAGNQAVADAMEDGRVDIFRAMQLARVQDAEKVEELIGVARDMPPNDFVALVQSVATSNTSYSLDDGRLADVDRKLALVREVTPVGLAHLRRIAERARELIRLAESPGAGDSKIQQASGQTRSRYRHGGPAAALNAYAEPRSICATLLVWTAVHAPGGDIYNAVTDGAVSRRPEDVGERQYAPGDALVETNGEWVAVGNLTDTDAPVIATALLPCRRR